MAYKIQFHIVDREFCDKYNWVGYFTSVKEAGEFVRDNVRAGNKATVISAERITRAEYNRVVTPQGSPLTALSCSIGKSIENL